MSSWLSSLETVIRLQHWAIWLAILSAVTAAASGAVAYYLSGVESNLRERTVEARLSAAQADLDKTAQFESEELTSLRRQLDESFAKAEGLEEQVKSLEKKLATASRPTAEAANARRPSSPAKPEVSKAETDGFLTRAQMSRLVAALGGQPNGEATLVSVSGDPLSLANAQLLESALSRAGWTVAVIQAVFASPPEELVFVVHGRDSLPPRQIALARALAELGLIQLPAKVLINPNRPPGFMGLVVPGAKPPSPAQ